MAKTCVFSGTFDPPTKGHKDIIGQALKIFDGVTVAVMVNTDKRCLFSREERLYLLNELFKGDKRIKVREFSGAAVDLLKEEGTPFYVRGVRDAIDFEYENRNHFASKKLMDEMVTIYIPATQEDIHISSTLVRNSFVFKKDYFDYVPEEIKSDVKKMLEAKNV